MRGHIIYVKLSSLSLQGTLPSHAILMPSYGIMSKNFLLQKYLRPNVEVERYVIFIGNGRVTISLPSYSENMRKCLD